MYMYKHGKIQLLDFCTRATIFQPKQNLCFIFGKTPNPNEHDLHCNAITKMWFFLPSKPVSFRRTLSKVFSFCDMESHSANSLMQFLCSPQDRTKRFRFLILILSACGGDDLFFLSVELLSCDVVKIKDTMKFL